MTTQPTRRVIAAAPELSIDWTRCDGHGLCAAMLPRSIGRDDWGFPIIDSSLVAAENPRDVRRAVSSCPALALRLTR
jgi:ferredoxin